MAERIQQVVDRLAELLQEEPTASSRDLFEFAKGVDPAIGGLSLRQFNASYILPLKRRGGSGKVGKRTRRGREPKAGNRDGALEKHSGVRESVAPAVGPTAPRGSHEGVRAVLLRFASDFSEAKSRSAVVAVLARLDDYVAAIEEARQ